MRPRLLARWPPARLAQRLSEEFRQPTWVMPRGVATGPGSIHAERNTPGAPGEVWFALSASVASKSYAITDPRKGMTPLPDTGPANLLDRPETRPTCRSR